MGVEWLVGFPSVMLIHAQSGTTRWLSLDHLQENNDDE